MDYTIVFGGDLEIDLECIFDEAVSKNLFTLSLGNACDFTYLHSGFDLFDELRKQPSHSQKILIYFDQSLIATHEIIWRTTLISVKQIMDIAKSGDSRQTEFARDFPVEIVLVDYDIHIDQLDHETFFKKAIHVEYHIKDLNVYYAKKLRVKQDVTVLDMSLHRRVAFNDLGEKCPHLIDLDLSRNLQPFLSEFSFGAEFKHVKRLCLSKNLICRVDEVAFDQFLSLEYLNLSSNLLDELNYVAFHALDNLVTLDLSNNKIREVTASMFATLLNLRTLNLSWNMLRQLESDVFARLVCLTDLRLNHNCLSQVHAGTFRNLTTLTTLFMNNNCLEELSARAFVDLLALEILDVSANKLRRVPDFKLAAGNQSHLKALCLHHNQIVAVRRGDFGELGSLKLLLLNANKISHIEAYSFVHLARLKVLFLYDNELDDDFEYASLVTDLRKLRYFLTRCELSKIKELIMHIRLKKYRNLVDFESFKM